MNTSAEHIREQVDPVQYIGQYVPLKRSGAWFTGKCPFHNDRTPSFAVHAAKKRWSCFAACSTGGDVIAFAMKYHSWDFKNACQELAAWANLDANTQPQKRRQTAPPIAPLSEPPPLDWQQHAGSIVQRAEQVLWSDRGETVLGYLLNERELHEETIRAARLGFVPAASPEDAMYGRVIYPDWRKDDGKPRRVPCGITIPHFAEGALWGVKVRRLSGSPKYLAIDGSRPTLYGTDQVIPGWRVLITEGEFDALIVQQIERTQYVDISGVSLGSASHKHLNRRWWKYLQSAPEVLVRVDNDPAGQTAAAELQTLSQSVKVIQVPTGKDLNDFYLAVGGLKAADWLEAQFSTEV